MRDGWNGLRAEFLRSVSTLQAEREFKQLPDPALQRFESPSALIACLNDPGGDLDEKDRVYRTLVLGIQQHRGQSNLAWPLMWLGLWPGLHHIYQRHRRQLWDSLRDHEEVVETICALFSEVVGRADLDRINRLAATLVRNTGREVRAVLKRTWAEAEKRRDLPEDDRLEGQRGVDPRFLAAGGTALQDLAALRARLLQVLGPENVDLVLDVVGGATQKDAGAMQGLSPGVSRKRYERAIDRLREGEGVVPLAPRTRRFSDEGGHR